MTDEMINALKLAASAQGIPPEVVERFAEVIDDMEDLLHSAIERNRAQALAMSLSAVEVLRRLGKTEVADAMLGAMLVRIEEEFEEREPEPGGTGTPPN